ncbi:MAG: hypothetical protein KKF44_11335 [Nanoarchaeota archaeon]|nr:hypothetical protein [Nanoarchaeota archaeon]
MGSDNFPFKIEAETSPFVPNFSYKINYSKTDAQNLGVPLQVIKNDLDISIKVNYKGRKKEPTEETIKQFEPFDATIIPFDWLIDNVNESGPDSKSVEVSFAYKPYHNGERTRTFKYNLNGYIVDRFLKGYRGFKPLSEPVQHYIPTQRLGNISMDAGSKVVTVNLTT